MIVRALQAVHLKNCGELRRKLLMAACGTTSRSTIKICNDKASISIFLGKFSPATRELMNPKIVAQLAAKDQMPPSYTLIYRSNLPTYLVLCQTIVGTGFVAAVLLLMGMLVVEKKPGDSEPHIPPEDEFRQKVKAFAKEHIPPDSDEEPPPNPSPFDFRSDDYQLFGALMMCLVSLLALMYRLQNMVPARIYIKRSKHCVAVLYGSIIPGRISHHEFLAGTVTSLEKPNALFSQYMYKDATGKRLVMLDHYFRVPADLHILLGKGYVKP